LFLRGFPFTIGTGSVGNTAAQTTRFSRETEGVVSKLLVISMVVLALVLSVCVSMLWTSLRPGPAGSCQDALARRPDAEVHLASALDESDRQEARDRLAAIDEEIRRAC
jgi:hypothetical protein